MQELESKLDSFDRETSVQICLVVVPDLGGFEVSDYATRLFEKWGIGRAKQDDGVLLLLALQERKIRIETGYGLESVITDALSRRLIEQKIAPALRGGGVAEGLKAGSNGLMSLIRGDYQDLEARPEGDGGKPIGGSALFWILLGLVLLLILSKKGGGGGQGVGRDGVHALCRENQHHLGVAARAGELREADRFAGSIDLDFFTGFAFFSVQFFLGFLVQRPA